MNRAAALVVGTGSVLLLVATSLACGGKVSGGADGGLQAAGTGAEGAADPQAVAAACGHYDAAQYSRCGGPTLPSSEESRVRARSVQVCLDQMALPGSGMTAASVEACASALDASACELPGGPPVACKFNGSLPGGAPCNEGLQCQSGLCQGTASYSPGGRIGPFTCGTCAPAVAVGQVCGHGSFSGGCASDAVCAIDPGDETASMPTYSCVAITEGDVGAACDDLAARCKTGLYCAAATHQCTPPGHAGAPCGEGPRAPGWPGGCTAPLSCVGAPGMATCSSGAAGASCRADSDCSSGLGCSAGTCEPVRWASPGQACDGRQTRCLVGSCNVPPGPPAADGGVAQGSCPSVIADGQPCTVGGEGVGPTAGNGPTCDTFAECFRATGPAGMDGAMSTCTLLDSTVCR